MKLLVLVGFLCFNFSYADAAKFWQLELQDPAIPVMEGIIDFHNHLMIFILPITVFVIWLLYRSLHFYLYFRKISFSCIYEKYFGGCILVEVV
jgi:heme/copper-type cytochrome/quinol oxidase subunit 2